MADINATNLTPETLSTLDGTENIVAFDTAEGKKIPLSVLGDYVVQKLTQTLMGDSQTLQTAINTLNDNAIKHKIDASQTIESNTDINDLLTPGTYVCPNSNVAATLTNWPSSNVAGRMEVIEILRSSTGTASSLRTRQIVRTNNTSAEFQRYWNGSTWSDWLRSPTRAEMDATTNKMSGLTGIFNTDLALSGSSTQQYNVPNSSQHLIILQAASRTAHGIYLVSTTSSGIMQLTEVIKGENITVSAPSANTLEIANAYANGCYVTDICLRGSAITKVTEPSS